MTIEKLGIENQNIFYNNNVAEHLLQPLHSHKTNCSRKGFTVHWQMTENLNRLNLNVTHWVMMKLKLTFFILNYLSQRFAPNVKSDWGKKNFHGSPDTKLLDEYQ